MASTGRVQVLLFLGGSGGLPPNETTFAKRLQQHGYTTGLVGKRRSGLTQNSSNILLLKIELTIHKSVTLPPSFVENSLPLFSLYVD